MKPLMQQGESTHLQILALGEDENQGVFTLSKARYLGVHKV